jgi:hypothetical protein
MRRRRAGGDRHGHGHGASGPVTVTVTRKVAANGASDPPATGKPYSASEDSTSLRPGSTSTSSCQLEP